MNYFNFALAAVFLSGLVGCSSVDCDPNKLRTGKALPGTKTVVVGISIGSDGMPQESYKDVAVHPGERVLYAGPDEFAIIFKNRKTPNEKVENKSENGVVIIDIPEDIFEKKEFAEEFRKNKFLTFDYGIRANGKELDPPMIILPH
jgi:hypothetical protein